MGMAYLTAYSAINLLPPQQMDGTFALIAPLAPPPLGSDWPIFPQNPLQQRNSTVNDHAVGQSVCGF